MTCRYFATCDHPAAGFVANPVLGPVPCCDRCREVVGADFMAPEPQELDDFLAGYIECALWADLDMSPRCYECKGPAKPCESCPHGEGDVVCDNAECDHYGEHVRELGEIGAGDDWPDWVDRISDEARATMREECASFMAGCLADLREYCGQLGDWSGSDGSTPAAMARAGHDFWLTRNGHGAGFWDRGLGELGERLTAVAKPYSSAYVYVGGDGKVYV